MELCFRPDAKSNTDCIRERLLHTIQCMESDTKQCDLVLADQLNRHKHCKFNDLCLYGMSVTDWSDQYNSIFTCQRKQNISMVRNKNGHGHLPCSTICICIR